MNGIRGIAACLPFFGAVLAHSALLHADGEDNGFIRIHPEDGHTGPSK